MLYHIPDNDDRHDAPVCDCITCPECEGEGSMLVFTPAERWRYIGPPDESEFWQTCEKCGGSGKLTEDCAIHDCELPTFAGAVMIPEMP